jgi:hypothetical protein
VVVATRAKEDVADKEDVAGVDAVAEAEDAVTLHPPFA